MIGTGAKAIQLIPEVAHQAVPQRTPNYVVPARNHPLADSQMGELKRNYDTMWDELRKQPFALPIPTSGRIAADMPDPPNGSASSTPSGRPAASASSSNRSMT